MCVKCSDTTKFYVSLLRYGGRERFGHSSSVTMLAKCGGERNGNFFGMQISSRNFPSPCKKSCVNSKYLFGKSGVSLGFEPSCPDERQRSKLTGLFILHCFICINVIRNNHTVNQSCTSTNRTHKYLFCSARK